MLSTLATTALVAERHVGPGYGPGFGFLFLLVPLFWIGVIALIIAIVGRRWRRNGGPTGQPSWASRGAEGSLAERFAQGDIDENEYRTRLDVLRSSRPDPKKR